MAQLWWAYDEENVSFTPLPASPWLFPALFVLGFRKLFRRQTLPTENKPVFCRYANNIDPVEYRANRAIYLRLKESWRKNGGWTDQEYFLNRKITQPSWALPHESWSYEHDL